jgi:hypothetical protein
MIRSLLVYTGATAVRLGQATWISRLRELRWVPAALPGSSECVCLRPCEVDLASSLRLAEASQGAHKARAGSANALLAASQANRATSQTANQAPASSSRAQSSGDATTDMPVSTLPLSVLRSLSNMDERLAASLAWGTVKPPAPVDRFEELIRSINSQYAADRAADGGAAYSHFVSCSRAEYEEVCAMWSMLCAALSERRLSAEEMRKIKVACGIQDRTANTAPILSSRSICCIPGPTSRALLGDRFLLYPVAMCCSLSLKTGTSDRNAQLSASIALSRVGFLLDLGPREYDSGLSDARLPPVRSPWFTAACDWPLDKHRQEMAAILSPAGAMAKSHAAAFLSLLSAAADDIATHYSPDVFLKAAYSHSCWAIVSDRFPPSALSAAGGSAPLDMASIEAARRELQSQVPNLRIFCRKNSYSVLPARSEFPVRWHAVWNRSSSAAQIMLALIDDHRQPVAGCGVTVCSLLGMEHAVQGVGLLDHSLGNARGDVIQPEYVDFSELAAVDKVLLQVFGIPRTSDPKMFSVEVRTMGKSSRLADASARQCVVLLLLRLMHENSSNASEQSISVHSNASMFLPVMKYQTLTLSFKYPAYESGSLTHKTSTIQRFALRGPLVPASNDLSFCTDEVRKWLLNESTMDPEKERKLRSMYIAGDADDYGTELGDFLVTHLFGKYCHFDNSQSVRTILSLLNYLENASKFDKLFSRHYGKHILQSGEAASVPESMCVRAIREIMGHFNKTAAAPISSIYGNAPSDDLHRGTASKAEGDAVISVPGSGGRPIRPTDLESLELSEVLAGRGRGVSNKPAWMAATASSEPLKVEDASSEADDSAPAKRDPFQAMPSNERSYEPPLSDQQRTGALAGRGRGVSNRPAWMSTIGDSEGPHQAALPLSSDSSGVAPSGLDTNADAHAEIFLNSLSLPATSLSEPKTSVEDVKVPAGRGVGRGVINIPAWMTSEGESLLAGSKRTFQSLDSDTQEITAVQKVMRPDYSGVANVSLRLNTPYDEKSTHELFEMLNVIKDSIENQISEAQLLIKHWPSADNTLLNPTAFEVILKHAKKYGMRPDICETIKLLLSHMVVAKKI